MAATTQPDFAALLATVTTEPGKLSTAFRAFHDYSLGNQLLALWQCMERGLPLGPIATYKRWQELGRHVTKGAKAIELCMPITLRREDKETGEETRFTRFTYKRNWFVLAQTDGAAYEAPPVPGWNKVAALAALDVTEVPYALVSGNVQGYASKRTVAVNPVAAHPAQTLFHELAHVVLGHTLEGDLQDAGDRTPRDVRELEAEATAMLCAAALGLPGVEESRGYVQHWYGHGSTVPEASARKIFTVADKILKAGRVEAAR